MRSLSDRDAASEIMSSAVNRRAITKFYQVLRQLRRARPTPSGPFRHPCHARRRDQIQQRQAFIHSCEQDAFDLRIEPHRPEDRAVSRSGRHRAPAQEKVLYIGPITLAHNRRARLHIENACLGCQCLALAAGPVRHRRQVDREAIDIGDGAEPGEANPQPKDTVGHRWIQRQRAKDRFVRRAGEAPVLRVAGNSLAWPRSDNIAPILPVLRPTRSSGQER